MDPLPRNKAALIAARLRAGVTQEELAAVLGTTQERVSTYERNRKALPFSTGIKSDRLRYLAALAIASAVLPIEAVPTEG